MKSSPLKYITDITHIHIEQSMHINVCIPVTITYVQENRKIERKIKVCNINCLAVSFNF